MPVEVMRGFESVRLQDPRGLRPVGDVAGRVVQPSRRERKPGSIGSRSGRRDEGRRRRRRRPQGEVGEIVIRGHNVMKATGARRRRRRPCAGGWFHTGDMARVDADGYFFIVDRKKDMIIRGGYNVYPREIEEVLYEHPAVARRGHRRRRRRARRGGRRRHRARPGERRRRGRCAPTSRSASPPTSTRGGSGSSKSCPRAHRQGAQARDPCPGRLRDPRAPGRLRAPRRRGRPGA